MLIESWKGISILQQQALAHPDSCGASEIHKLRVLLEALSNVSIKMHILLSSNIRLQSHCSSHSRLLQYLSWCYFQKQCTSFVLPTGYSPASHSVSRHNQSATNQETRLDVKQLDTSVSFYFQASLAPLLLALINQLKKIPAILFKEQWISDWRQTL